MENRSRNPNFVTFTIHDRIVLEKVRRLLITEKGRRKRRKSEVESCHRILKTIWFLICSTGLVFHSWMTTREYLEYKTNTEVKIYIPSKLRPPAASLCLMLSKVVNVSRMEAEDQESMVKNRRSRIEDQESMMKNRRSRIEDQESMMKNRCGFLDQSCLDILSKYNMVEIMNHLTYNMETNEPEIVEKFNQTTYYKKGFKCVKYDIKRKEPDQLLDFGDIDGMTMENDSIIRTELPNNFLEVNLTRLTVATIIHDSKTLSRIRHGNIVWLSFDSGNFHLVTFDHVESETLKSPFRTRCIEYSRTEFDSQGECLENCYESQYWKKHGLNVGLITTNNFSKAILPSKSELKYDKSIDNSCTNHCTEGCLSLLYVSVKVGDYNLDDKNPIFSHNIILARTFAKVKLLPSFDISSFIIFMASIAGLWLGCNLFSSVTEFFIIVSNFRWARFLSED